MSDWTKRPYNPAWDREGVTYLWIRSHTVQGARGRRLRRLLDVDEDFRAHVPSVHWLLERSTCEVLCDPDRSEPGPLGPPIIWAFVAYELEPRPLLHYAAVKNSVIDGVDYTLAAEMIRELIGPLRTRDVVGVTHEIPLLNRPEMRALGASRGERWYMDDTYFARIFGQQEKEAS